MFSIEEWQNDRWAVVRSGVPESERAGLMASNLDSGNTYLQDAPVDLPASGTVFRFVDTP